MGELHLEIARDRLISDFKARARIGKIDINYREAVEGASREGVEVVVDREIGGKFAHAAASASVAPLATADSLSIHSESAQQIDLPDNNRLTILHPTLSSDGRLKDSDKDPFPPQLTFSAAIVALKSGVSAALARGPSYGFPVHATLITLTLDPESQVFSDTSATALSVAAREAVQAALAAMKAESPFALMEPVMLVTISVGEAELGGVVHDLSSARGGQIISLDDDEPTPSSSSSTSSSEEKLTINPNLIYAPPDPFGSEMLGSTAGATRLRQITARVPLREMVGYLKHLRSLTGGRGTFVMAVEGFEKVTGSRLVEVMKEIRG
jgi:elongation factor G